MTALNAQSRMDLEAASIGSSVVPFVRRFGKLSHFPLVALTLVLGACSGNVSEPSSAVFENQKTSQTVNNNKFNPQDYNKLNSKAVLANEVLKVVSPNVIFENFSEAQLAYLREINIPAEVSKMGQGRSQSIELNSGNRLFIAAGDSIENLCKSFYGNYSSPRSVQTKTSTDHWSKNFEFGVFVYEANNNSPIYILTHDFGHGCNENFVSSSNDFTFFLASFSRVRMVEGVVKINEGKFVNFEERPRK